MNKYEYYINQQHFCQEMAKIYSNADDLHLCVFYMNAAEGFRRKAELIEVMELKR